MKCGCSGCATTKLKKHSSYEGASLTICERVGEDWSADGTGRISFPLYGGVHYFLLFVENVSGYLAGKWNPTRASELALQQLKEVLVWSRTQTGNKVKQFRTDKEWISKARIF